MTNIQKEMSTKITIDTVQAANSMKSFRDAISASTNSWKAMETSLKSAGNYQQAAAERVKGLTNTIEIQKQRISELRERQSGLDKSTQQGAQQFIKLENQISNANKTLAGYEGQLSKAKSSSTYYSSGLSELQRQYKLNSDASKTYVGRLQAEGRSSDAEKAKLEGLKTSYKNLQDQLSIQNSELGKIERTNGKTSNSYVKQKMRVDQTKTSISQLKTQISELNQSANPTKLEALSNRLKAYKEKTDKAKESTSRFKAVLGGTFVSNAITGGLVMLQSQLSGIVTTGLQVAKTASVIKTRWESMGVANAGVKQLMNTMTDVKTNSNLSAEAVNKLQTQFYGLTGSVEKTNTLTKGVAQLSDNLKLSQDQAEGFASGLTKIEASGNVTAGTFGRLTKQAPGLATALAKTAGMSQDEFMKLVQSGKMTSDQFNDLLEKASKDYSKTSKTWGETSGGQLHRLQENWKTTQAKLAEPLIKVQATGLGELNKALNNKDTQKGIVQLGNAMANLAVKLAKVIGYMGTHQNVVKTFFAAFAGYVVLKKVASGVTGLVSGLVTFQQNIPKAVDGIKKIASGFKSVASFMVANPFTIWIVAIGALVVAFVELYKHNKKFKKFVDGLVKWSKKAVKDVIKWFKQLPENIGKFFDSIKKKAESIWNGITKPFKKGWNAISKTTTSGINAVNKGWNNLKSKSTKTAQSMFNSHKKTFRSGYKALQSYTKIWSDLMHGHWKNLGKDIQNYAKNIWKFVSNIFKEAYDKLNDLTGGKLGEMVDYWKDKLGNIKDAIADAKEAIHTKFVDIVRAIIKPFNALLSGLKKGINWVLSKLGASTISADWSIPMPSYAAGTKDTHPGGLAKVNDGQSDHYREMYRLPNGELGIFPATRNMIVPLPKGTSILDGEQTYQLLSKIPHYASGVGDLLSSIAKKSKSLLSAIDPVSFMEDVFKRYVNVSSNVDFVNNIVTNLPKMIANSSAKWLKDLFKKLSDTFDDDDKKSKKKKGALAYGGLVSTSGLYELAENGKAEYVIPTDINKRGRANQLLSEVNARFRSDDPTFITNGTSTKVVERKLDMMISLLSQLLGVSAEQIKAIRSSAFNKNDYYKQEALDLNRVSYQG
ncbi:tape measure protein [Limosilactobacillus gastricus]|uniref:tape measure protein n=1 Tax=Limosilactobacillus gastricus TaxID=227942 RepID=UPI0026EF19DA|nr:tape measure protein [Limosilactobacillus gastricus]